MAYTGPYGWSSTGTASGFARDPNDSNRYFFQDQAGQFIGNPMAYDQLGMYFNMNGGGPLANAQMPTGVQNYYSASAPQQIGMSAPQPTTSAAPVAQPGTATAQSVGTPYTQPATTGPVTASTTGASTMSGPAPLTNAVKQGFGMGLSGFDPQWLDKLGANLYGQASKNFLENVNPALDSQAIMAGGFGGDRAALAKGTAAGRMSEGVTNALAPLYHAGYQSSLDRGLRTGESAMQGVLGLGAQDINRYQVDTQRGLGVGDLGVKQYLADIEAQKLAVDSEGKPIYTNPLASGFGGAFGLSSLYNILFPKG